MTSYVGTFQVGDVRGSYRVESIDRYVDGQGKKRERLHLVCKCGKRRTMTPCEYASGRNRTCVDCARSAQKVATKKLFRSIGISAERKASAPPRCPCGCGAFAHLCLRDDPIRRGAHA